MTTFRASACPSPALPWNDTARRLEHVRRIPVVGNRCLAENEHVEDYDEIKTLWGRWACRLNILSGFLALVDFIPALVALASLVGPPFDGPVPFTTNVLVVLVGAFPVFTIASIRMSHSYIRTGGEWEGFVISLAPFVVVAVAAALALLG